LAPWIVFFNQTDRSRTEILVVEVSANRNEAKVVMPRRSVELAESGTFGSEMPGHSGSVLIVDDDPSVGRLLKPWSDEDFTAGFVKAQLPRGEF